VVARGRSGARTRVLLAQETRAETHAAFFDRGLRVAFAVDELSREGVHRPPGVPVEAELRVFQVAARAGETECRG